MLKIDLTEQAIQNLPYAETGKRVIFEDAAVENLRLAVGESNKVFFYAADLPGGPKTWVIGRFGPIHAERARDIARRLGRAVGGAPDPCGGADTSCEITIASQTPTFGNVVRAYAAQLPSRRHNRSAERDAKFLLHYFVDTVTNSWADKPINEVSETDILAFISNLRDRPALAHCCIRKIRAFYAWAMQPAQRQIFDLASNPATYIIPRHAAPYTSRQASFFERELQAYLVAVETLEPPYRAFAEALALTGERPSELSLMRWAELDVAKSTWMAVRRKVSKPIKRPFSDSMGTLLRNIQSDLTGDMGEYVFSTTNGRSAITRFSEMKSSLDRQMATILGRPPEWKWTDLRRCVKWMLMEHGLSHKQAAYALGSGSPRTEDRLQPREFWHWNDKAIRTALNRYAASVEEIRKERI
ncbi:tyrosine-type recombinase/integrase [Rhizobium rhizogenes]|uniref:tyrosine-type recombinase/integrase n=1 Tax=Rhizobium rhizogenes TaxID=359 RepID=UPI0022CCCC64|nr:tyrosine-type recombinase/integrase [Rhizobium rhizogenes]MCZ7454400.1 tyrosine-type recombinase/integrase [Rhizobium rhizogenes]